MLLPIAAHKETQCLSSSASYCTAHLLYKYCTNCTNWNWRVLTVITQKLLLPDQLPNRRETVKLISSELECSWWFEIVCIYRESYREIRSFKFTLLAEIEVRNLYSDKEQVDVTQITNTMCKLKVNRCTVSVKCWFVWIFSEHTEFYSNVLTLQLALHVKYLPYYSKRLIYITVFHSVMTITTHFITTNQHQSPVQ